MRKKTAENLVNKVKETEYFLADLLSGHKSLSTAGYLFAAFVSSARSISFVIQYLGADCSGFDEWYAGRQKEMKTCKVSKYLLDWRNYTQKTGVVPVVSAGYTEGRESIVKYNFSRELGEVPEIGAEKSVNFYCYFYMLRMISLAYDFFERFESHFYDPKDIRNRLQKIDNDSLRQCGKPVFGTQLIEKFVSQTPTKKLAMMRERWVEQAN